MGSWQRWNMGTPGRVVSPSDRPPLRQSCWIGETVGYGLQTCSSAVCLSAAWTSERSDQSLIAWLVKRCTAVCCSAFRPQAPAEDDHAFYSPKSSVAALVRRSFLIIINRTVIFLMSGEIENGPVWAEQTFQSEFHDSWYVLLRIFVIYCRDAKKK